MTCCDGARLPVIVVGNIIYDTVLAMDEVLRDHKQWIDAPKSYCGGQAANVAAALSFLGCEVEFVGRLGDDAAGQICRRAMQLAGVDMSACAIAAETSTMTGHVIVETRHAMRTILMNRDEKIEGAFPDLSKVNTDAAAAIISDGYELDVLQCLLDGFDVAHRPPVFLNVEYLSNDYHGLISIVDYCVLSEELAAEIVGVSACATTCDALLSLFPNLLAVCTTAGADGAKLQVRSYNHAAPLNLMPKPVEVVDTTGAGDAFMAGLVYGFTKGFAPKMALEIAHTVAEATCQTPGPRASPEKLNLALKELLRIRQSDNRDQLGRGR